MSERLRPGNEPRKLTEIPWGNEQIIALEFERNYAVLTRCNERVLLAFSKSSRNLPDLHINRDRKVPIIIPKTGEESAVYHLDDQPRVFSTLNVGIREKRPILYIGEAYKVYFVNLGKDMSTLEVKVETPDKFDVEIIPENLKQALKLLNS